MFAKTGSGAQRDQDRGNTRIDGGVMVGMDAISWFSRAFTLGRAAARDAAMSWGAPGSDTRASAAAAAAAA